MSTTILSFIILASFNLHDVYLPRMFNLSKDTRAMPADPWYSLSSGTVLLLIANYRENLVDDRLHAIL